MAVNAKLGVDLSSFEAGIRSGQAILKGLNAEMKATEAEFKATGNSEQKLANQTKTLNSTLQAQKGIADQARQALKAMDDAGVDPANTAYQKLYATMMNATAGMNEAQAQLNALGNSAQDAASGADQLTTSVNKIGKKISLDQVLSGINSITKGLESAAKKAVELGKAIWENVMDSASLSDDILTQASILDMTPEKYQQYKGVFDTIAEITVKDWMNAKRKVEKAMNDPSNDQIDALKALGFGNYVDKYGVVRKREIADNWEDGLWAIADELQKRVDSGEISMEMADVYGEALFGKNFSTLKNLFKLGQEGFKEALWKQSVISDEALEKNAALNDQMIKLKKSFDDLQAEVTSALAPALTDAATALDGLLGEVLEYLKTEEGQEMLKGLGDAVTELFSGMRNINAEDVVNGFKDAFDKVMGVLNWIVENKDSVVAAIEGIFGFWATLKVSSGVLTILKVINGIKDIAGMGGAGAAATAGGTTSNWLTAGLKTGLANLAKVAPFAAPFLLGIDGIIHDQQLIAEWTANGATAMQDYTNKSSIYQGQDMYGIWDTLTRYSIATGTGPEDQDKLIEFAHHYVDWMNDKVADPMLAALTDQMSQEGFDNFDDIMTRIVNGEHFYSNEDLAALGKAINDAINAAEEIMKPAVNVDVKVPDDSAAQITQQVGTVLINGRIVANGITEESFANGIHSVPYDGMLARLHKGERVVPAREVQSRSYNSNLYVESMYMNNGTDAAGLAAAMAAAQRRTMSGFGS